MSIKCFVPKCENIGGISFPRQNDLKKKWLENLQITDCAPKSDSLICLDHFNESDVFRNSDDVTLCSVKRGALPNLNPVREIKNAPQKAETVEEIQEIVNQSASNIKLENETATVEEAQNDTATLMQILEDPQEPIQEEVQEVVQEVMEVEHEEEQNGEIILENEENFTEQIIEHVSENSENTVTIHASDIDSEHAEIIDNSVQTYVEADTHEENGLVSKVEPFALAQYTTEIPQEQHLIYVKTKTCRLCMSDKGLFRNVMAPFQDGLSIMVAITLCVNPLRINQNDSLSKEICRKCFNSLQRFYEFRKMCLNSDEVQMQNEAGSSGIKSIKSTKRSFDEMNSSEISMENSVSDDYTIRHQNSLFVSDKNRIISSYPEEKGKVFNASKNRIIGNTTIKILSPTTKPRKSKLDQGPDASKSGFLSITKVKKQPPTKTSQTPTRKETSIVTYGKVIPGQKSPVKKLETAELERKKQLNIKYDKVEEELRKMLEGTMSKDDITVDNVIVRVVSDDEEEGIVKHVEKPPQPFPRKVTSVKIKKEPSGLHIIDGEEQVSLPKGIRLTVQEAYESHIGEFPCTSKIGDFGIEFALIDNYLFEYRLCKGTLIELRCVTPNCKASGTRQIDENGHYSEVVAVTVPHNHRPFSRTELKKQMFYFVLRKKMAVDKTTNFRVIYEQLCKSDPEMKRLVPLKNVINEICRHQNLYRIPQISSFDEFYDRIEEDVFQRLQFTTTNKQFFQDKFTVPGENSKAIIFADIDTIQKVSSSNLMYVDSSFRIETNEDFKYQLVTVLVWHLESYYPIMFALVNKTTFEVFKRIFAYLHDTLAPNLCPDEIVTDYESNIYYALGETYIESHIGGSVFYYTQNLYKKLCSFNLARELETNSYFRNIYHMLLMLPLLPVNTIEDGLNNIEIQAADLGLEELSKPMFDYVKSEWMGKVTPDLFCVHRLEKRINENVISPFKKLRDFLMLSKGKQQKTAITILTVVEKLVELEGFLKTATGKKQFGRDLSSSQKKNVLRAWQFIETHPKININNFFLKVLGYIKCMENQLWIWGFYKFEGDASEDLIDASYFSIVNTNEPEMEQKMIKMNHARSDSEDNEDPDCDPLLDDDAEYIFAEEGTTGEHESTVVVEAMVDPTSGEFVIPPNQEHNIDIEGSLIKYVCEVDEQEHEQ